jgi:hypothetical protein
MRKAIRYWNIKKCSYHQSDVPQSQAMHSLTSVLFFYALNIILTKKYMSSEEFGEMFEGDSADMCSGLFFTHVDGGLID